MIERCCYSLTALGSNLTVVVDFAEFQNPETAVVEETDAVVVQELELPAVSKTYVPVPLPKTLLSSTCPSCSYMDHSHVQRQQKLTHGR